MGDGLSKGACRTVYVLGIPAMVVLCLGGAVWAVAASGSALAALPFAGLGGMLAAKIDKVMVWLSTPSEQEALLRSDRLRLLMERVGRRLRPRDPGAGNPGPT